MSYFKRRIKDSWQITKEICSSVTWINAIIMIPALLFLMPFVWFWMLFEDYGEIDRAKEVFNQIYKSEEDERT
jgi:hypothetical protein